MSITFQRTVEFLMNAWENRAEAPLPSVLLLGPPGIGKTSIAYEVLKRMREKHPDAKIEVLDLTSRAPEDVGGLPKREDVVIYTPQRWAAEMAKPGTKGIIVFDDLPAASPATAVAVRQAVLDRRIHDCVFSDDVLILVTGNRRGDGAGANTLPSQFRNAVCILEVEPSFDEWTNWFINSGGDVTIPSFLKWKPNLFSTLPKDADAKGSFATPRTWAMLSRILKAAKASGNLSQVTSGFVGEGPGLEYIAFAEVMANLPQPEDVFADPEKALPDPKTLGTPDKLIAITSSLGYHAAKLAKARLADRRCAILAHEDGPALAIMEKYLSALAWVTQGSTEYVASSMTSYTAAGGSTDLLTAGSRSCTSPGLQDMIRKIRSSLR